MATEILLNDGGAPARILPFKAGGTVTAGQPVKMNTSAEVVQNDLVAHKPLGIALTTVSSGSMASIITGMGVILKANCTGSIAVGDALDTAAGGSLSTTADASKAVAIYIDSDSHAGAASLQKILYLG
tara:strand:- start:844 stop:1227 length:384 start_codon:yes stop_codon:yes gene_type:complete